MDIRTSGIKPSITPNPVSQPEPTVETTSTQPELTVQAKKSLFQSQSPSPPLLTSSEGLQELNQQITHTPSSVLLERAQTLPIISGLEKIMPQAPPQLNDEQLGHKIGQAISRPQAFSDFKQTVGLLHSKIDELDAQVKLPSMDETQAKKLKKYNAPLFKLAGKLGLVDRKGKLDRLNQAIANTQQLKTDSIRQLQGQISQLQQDLDTPLDTIREEGKAFVQLNKNDQALMWSLSTQPKNRLQEHFAKALVGNLPNGEELVAKYSEQMQAYDTQKNTYGDIREKCKIYDSKVAQFKKEEQALKKRVEALEKTDPQAALALKQEMAPFFEAARQEINDFHDQVLLPLVKNMDPTLISDKGRVHTQNIAKKPFQEDPPRLFDVLPTEHQNFVTQMVEGVQSSLPNRILDDTSVMINGTTYKNKTFLAEAGFAKVYSYESDQGQKIVIKEPHKPDEISDRDFQKLLEEQSGKELNVHYHAMGSDGVTGHPNIVKLVGAVHTDHGPLIAMEFVDKGDLHAFIHDDGSHVSRLTTQNHSPEDKERIQKTVLFQMLQGLDHVGDRGMTHFDIKFDNFLINSEGEVKVADFGLSKTETVFQGKRTDVGDNPIYKAPEALKLSDKYTVEMSNKLDSWALGVMAYKMFEGKFPFDDAFMSKIENKVSKFGSNPKNQVIEGTRAMTPYGELLNGLLHPDPQQRFSIKEALQSSFFNDITQVNESGERVLKPELHALLKQSLNA